MTALPIIARPPDAQVWLAAIRPATLTAAVGPVLVGSALAARDGALSPLVAASALVGAVFIQIGTNLFNDYADFEKGADTPDRLGPARATARGWLSPRSVLVGSLAAFAAAMVAGAYLVWSAGWLLLVVGLASIAAGIIYTGGPRPLAYVGLGDLFVMLFFGFVAVCGAYYVQAGTVSAAAAWCAVSVGALTTAILVVNNLRDRHTDARAQKRTLVVRFGQRFGRLEYAALLLLAYAMPAAVVLMGAADIPWLLPWLSAPLAFAQVRAIATKDGADLNPHLGGTARLGLLFALLLSVGVML